MKKKAPEIKAQSVDKGLIWRIPIVLVLSLIVGAGLFSIFSQFDMDSVPVMDYVHGRASTAGGFMWERVDTGTPVYSIAPAVQHSAENTSKSIYQVDSTGEIVAEFDSINSAERRTGINRKSIRDVLNGRQKTAGGYYWLRKHCE